MSSAGVVVTPGVGYGSLVEGYVRLSLSVPDDRLEEAVRRIHAVGGRLLEPAGVGEPA